MGNHLTSLLDNWYEQRDELQWVLATIIETDGSSYRKSGAMMMINSMGQYYGLLSGGCLESDIMRQARRCWENGINHTIEYDMREEEDLAWQLGIGCGGLVRILLQPVSASNQYLHLDSLQKQLIDNKKCEYRQRIDDLQPMNQLTTIDHDSARKCHIQTVDGQPWLVQQLTPPPHIAIFGGGVDAIPLVAIASSMGWQISLIDNRTSYARSSRFPQVNRIYRDAYQALKQQCWLQQIDAAVLMNHNVDMDAESLKIVQSSSAKYVGILGPIHRTNRVFERAQLQRSDIKSTLANPVGLRLGGELPESIALSIVAEINAFLEHADGKSISHVLP